MRTIAYRLSIASIIINIIEIVLIFIIFKIIERQFQQVYPWIKIPLLMLSILSLIWTILMTIATKKSIGDGKEHVCLAIFHMLLLPLGLISGILLLLPEKSNKDMKKNSLELDLDKQKITT